MGKINCYDEYRLFDIECDLTIQTAYSHEIALILHGGKNVAWQGEWMVYGEAVQPHAVPSQMKK